jgi:hypothetical protein
LGSTPSWLSPNVPLPSLSRTVLRHSRLVGLRFVVSGCAAFGATTVPSAVL